MLANADLETARNNLKIKESGAKAKSAYEQLVDKYEHAKSLRELQNDVALQKLLLGGQTEDSAAYRAQERQQNMKLREIILQQYNQLKALYPKITDESEKLKAELELWSLQKEANDLLLAIKNNTGAALGDFNVPGGMDVITYYDYRLRTTDRNVAGMEIANAHIAVQVDQIAPDGMNVGATVYNGLMQYNELLQRERMGHTDSGIDAFNSKRAYAV
jgi:hypothetical protein